MWCERGSLSCGILVYNIVVAAMNLETKLNMSLQDILRTSGYIVEIIANNKRLSNLIAGSSNEIIPPAIAQQLMGNLGKFDEILDDTISKFNDAKWCIDQIVENRQKQEEMKLKEEEERRKRAEEELERQRKLQEDLERKRRAEEEAKERERIRLEELEKQRKQLEERRAREQKEREEREAREREEREAKFREEEAETRKREELQKLEEQLQKELEQQISLLDFNFFEGLDGMNDRPGDAVEGLDAGDDMNDTSDLFYKNNDYVLNFDDDAGKKDLLDLGGDDNRLSNDNTQSGGDAQNNLSGKNNDDLKNSSGDKDAANLADVQMNELLANDELLNGLNMDMLDQGDLGDGNVNVDLGNDDGFDVDSFLNQFGEYD